ncbi:MAG TPA: hypothetical protein VJQ57_09520 [Acidimicrobiia bacterium]|nr:hypothetical protein [Acidimicrobiia bacterium]
MSPTIDSTYIVWASRHHGPHTIELALKVMHPLTTWRVSQIEHEANSLGKCMDGLVEIHRKLQTSNGVVHYPPQQQLQDLYALLNSVGLWVV